MPAFLILAHRSAAVFGDLFRYVYAPENRYLLHVDAKAPADLQRLARGLAAAFDNVELVESRNCSWGGFSLAAATRDGIKAALRRPGFGHFIVLSEQHVPLVATDEIAAALMPGVSEIQMLPVSEMVAAGQMDVTDRFAWDYRELPGVGMFATAQRDDMPGIEIYHGSQWLILDEGLCRTVATADVWDAFTGSLLADETALQSIAGMAGVKNSGRNRTWVATPERIGDASMIFGEEHFFAAKADGAFLFIRKRGDELPASVRAALEVNAAFSAAALAAIVGRQAIAFDVARPAMNAAELALHLRWDLNRLSPDLTIEALTPPVNAPACYIKLGYPGAPANVSLSVLSQDMRHFKIVLAWHRDFDGDFSSLAFCGLPTSVIRARVYGLAYHREIHVAGAPDYGFVELPDATDLRQLVAALRSYVALVAKLSDAVAELS